jgi:hypothetical protein
MFDGAANLYDNAFYRDGFTPSRFQRLCQALLLAEYSSLLVMDDSLGDRGADAYEPREQIAFAVYFPTRPRADNLLPKLVAKLGSDAAQVNAMRITQPVRQLVFITPFDPDAQFQSAAERMSAKNSLEILLKGQSALESLLRKHPSVRDQFFGVRSVADSLLDALSEALPLCTPMQPTLDGLAQSLRAVERLFLKQLQSVNGVVESQFRRYLTVLGAIIQKLTVADKVVTSPALEDSFHFILELLTQAHEVDPTQFRLLNERLLNEAIAAAGESNRGLRAFIENIRGFLDATTTVASLPHLGFQQRQVFTWWFATAMLRLRVLLVAPPPLERILQFAPFQRLLAMKRGNPRTFLDVYRHVSRVAKEHRPDLLPHLRPIRDMLDAQERAM